MPKKVIENIQVQSLPYFPQLSGAKNSRAITKHFTNTLLYLPAELTSMLTWLIYQSNVDNSFEYDSRLINKYSASIRAAEEMYKSSGKLRVDIKAIRANFKQLIEQGFVLPTSKPAIFIINPMLSYRAEYCRSKEYKLISQNYILIQSGEKGVVLNGILQGIVFPAGSTNHSKMVTFTTHYRQIINSKIAKKKTK